MRAMGHDRMIREDQYRTIHGLTVVLSFLIAFNAIKGNAMEPLSYEKDIRPIFRAHCFDCHGATDEMEGGLDLRLVRFMKEGGDSGPAIVSNDPQSSLLLERITSGEMPPGDTTLSDQELEILRNWIQQGCNTLRPEPETIESGLGITPEERDFWAFESIDTLTSQELNDRVPDSVATSDLDKQYLLESINSLVGQAASSNLKHFDEDQMRGELLDSARGTLLASEASKETLIRRVYFDLLGLPPSPEAMNEWLNHDTPTWYSDMLDKLLESPQYGERWGRHWLDVAGYSDSEGYTNSDAIRPWAWKYRDWVVDALNQDMPFNRFITEQLAGDELAGEIQGDLSEEQIGLLTATGFLRMAADGTGSGSNTPEARNQVIADTLKIIGTSLLGLSVQCAQCHDHRYDPIPQHDYYALRAVFEPAMNWQAWKVPNARRQSLYTQADRESAASIEKEAQVVATAKQTELDRYMSEALTAELERQPEELREALRVAYQTPKEQRTTEQSELLKKHPSVNITAGNLYQYIPESKPKLAEFDTKIQEIRSKKPEEQFLRILTEPSSEPPITRLFHRGDHQQPKQPITPHALQINCPENDLQHFPSTDPNRSTTGRRLAFAKWLTGPDHPLFARVITNRIWLHHFGTGIVRTPADFGRLGHRPTHPKLLDWLATEFRNQNWSLKALHRTIMESALYRQTRGQQYDLNSDPGVSDLSPATVEVLKHHQYAFSDLQRLDAESLRDSILMASGTLESTMGGKPVNVKEDATGAVIVDQNSGRRSLYIQSRRTKPVSILQTFDAPIMETNCEIRVNSTVATQSLMMLNSEFTLHHAAKLADRAANEPCVLPPNSSYIADEIATPNASSWSYGFGKYDVETGKLSRYSPLQFWTGTQWQAGENLPDPENGWALLNRSGGHPDSKDRSVIRSWQSNTEGSAFIQGTLSHGSPNGDGVQGRIVSDRSGLLGTWKTKQGSVKTEIKAFDLKPGETIHFITESMKSVTSDSFNWPVTIELEQPDQETKIIQSENGFSGPQESVDALPKQIERAWELVYQRRPSQDELSRTYEFLNRQIQTANQSPHFEKNLPTLRQCMTNLCQMLLSSNEFLYVE